MKQEKKVEWFQETLGVYSMSHLEKLLPSIASINKMQVKDYVEALKDENLIRTEKIGIGNWYWCFRSDAKKTKENALIRLRIEESSLSHNIAEIKKQIEEEMGKRAEDDEMLEDDGMDRKALLEAHETLLRELEILNKGLTGYIDNDPAEVERKVVEMKKFKQSAMRWTDNIESLECFITNVSGDRAQTAEIMHRTCGDEYVPGEGLKEL